MKIALIPARGGSKRIPKKNIKEFCGQPMIAYSIKAAKEANCFDHIIVSTDCEEIAKVAKEYGAEVPFIRPDDLSDDYATTMDVIKHCVQYYENKGETIESLCCLYATAPFVRPADLLKGLELLQADNVQYAFSATAFSFPIQRAFYLDEKRQINMFEPEHLLTRSQDLEEAYHDAGQFYWCKLDAIKNNLPFFAPHSAAILLDRDRVQDIDTPADWDFAQKLFQLLLEK